MKHLFNLQKQAILCLILSCSLFLPSSLSAAIIYVNPAAGGANNGSSWADAYLDLQSALAVAVAGDEIWVAQGLYLPSVEVDVDASGGSDEREKTFQIPNGVALYGGFLGGEMNLEDRDWINNLSILSGDLDMNDLDLDGNQISENTSDLQGNNAYHVIFTQNVNALTRLDGFVVTAGSAGNLVPPSGFSPNRDGAGWLDLDGVAPNSSSPQIYNCRFEGNFAEDQGGAIKIGSFQVGTFQPNIQHCTFSGNEALRSGGAIYLLGDEATIDSSLFSNNSTTNISGTDTGPASGGAVFMIGSNASFSACVFRNNSATGNPTGAFEGGGGGAVYVVQSSSPTNTLGPSVVNFLNCGFYDNATGGNGGGWGGAATHLSDGGNLTIQYTGCVFSGNSATDDGGAVANFARVITPPDMLPAILEPRFTNCTFTENDAAEEGGALYFLGFLNMGIEMLNAEVENSILYANTALIADPEIFNTANTLISHSLIQGSGGSGGGWDIGLGTDGGSNIDDDPLFSDPLDPDGVDGIAGTADDGLFPTATSPVIEQGNNAAAGLVGVSSDFVGAMRLQGSSVDMGAYEQEGSLICGPLPAGLSNQDIGNTGGYPGTVCYDAGTFEVDASGSGIWGRRDGFHFVFKTMNGNGEIIAQVDGIGFNSFWDMGGVMMRESLHRNSKNVFMGVNAGGKAFYQRRRTTNGLTAFLFAGNGDTPKWVRIIRFGNFFACYKSVDGSNWQWTGLFYVPMPHRIYVGLATSTPFFLAGTPNTYEFSNLSIQGISYLQPPFNESQLTEIEEHEGPREGLNPEAETFKLFPNPITSHSLLEVHLLQTDQVSIEMFDIQGRKLKEIYQGELQANQVYRFPFKKGKLAQGLYVIKMKGQQHDQFTYVQIGK